uniref:Uncharacterized protein n=1 Tax=Setaria viridis TaxID=4556 RepID=A0A4U6WHH6_SETVI|nr:hypothetical protein SEVIR_1G264700v2 [Setaria viridis]
MVICKPSNICTMISFISRFYMFTDVAVPLCDPGTSTAARRLVLKYNLIVCFLSNWGRKIYISIAECRHAPLISKMHLVVCTKPYCRTPAPHNYCSSSMAVYLGQ